MKRLAFAAALALVPGLALADTTGFHVVTNAAPIAATNTVANTPLTSPFYSVLATNVGSKVAYCQSGSSATTSSPAIQGGGQQQFDVTGFATFSCVTSGADTTTVNVSQGYGMALGGGGGGGGGSGGSVTVTGPLGTQTIAASVAVTSADGALVTLGSEADAAWTSGSGTLISIEKNIAAAVASAIPAGTNVIGYTSNDPCSYGAKTNVTISTASGTTALVTGVSAKKIYVCSFLVVAPSAVSVSLSEGSGATCGTSNQAGVIGVGTNGTAANGMAFAANSGAAYGNGSGSIAVTATAANYLCLFQSGTAQLAGNLTYVQQ